MTAPARAGDAISAGHPIPLTRLFTYGALGLPLAMAALPIYVHVPKFYADTLGMNLATVGGLLLLARIFDAVQDPLLGLLSDWRKARSGGRLGLVLLGVPLLALGMVALFSPPSTIALGVWLIGALLVIYTAYSLVSISYQAYGAELSADYHERTRITAVREGLSVVGVLLAAALPEVLAQRYGIRNGFIYFAWIFAPLALAAGLITVFLSPKPIQVPSGPAASISWRVMLKPLKNGAFRRLLIVFVLNGIAVSIPATLVLFFVQDVIQRPQLTAVFLIVYFLAGAVGMPAWVWLARRVGKHRAWLAGMVLSIIAFVWAFTLSAGDASAFGIICVMSGLGLGADLALPPSMLADVIDEDERNGLARGEGSYFGLWNLATKLNLALAAGLALPLLDWWGYQPNTQHTPSVLTALAATYALLPCALKALAAATLLWAARDLSTRNIPLASGEISS